MKENSQENYPEKKFGSLREKSTKGKVSLVNWHIFNYFQKTLHGKICHHVETSTFYEANS